MDESSAKEKETVKVVVRCRPLFGKEIVEGRKPIVTIDPQACIISIKCPENDQVKSFTFDSVYDESTSQRQFYDESGYPLVESIFEGYNGTIFAYGQTGCGKTHTMQGKDSPPELRGVIPHSFDHIFESISADPSREYMVRASYLEIYNEDIRDLLGDDSKKKLDLKEGADGSVYVKDLTEVVVSDVDSINRVMNRGFKNRTVGSTLMNEGSSRSHSIFTVVVETSQKIGDQEHFKAGKLNLVDLAGSERQSKTGATGNRLKEGCKINLSLSALGNVISALVDGKGKHIPYRDSKLTRLLQDSLGGNTKTLMVAAVSPADYNYDETLSTLRYANRAKNIKNKPIVNEDPKDAKLREYKEEIERLKKMLETQSRGSGLGSASGMTTPSRSMLSSPENATRAVSTPVVAVAVANAELVDQAVAKEREEIAKYQKEAAEMLQRAKQMMDEARALQEEQQRAQVLALQQQTEQLKEESVVNVVQPDAAHESKATAPRLAGTDGPADSAQQRVASDTGSPPAASIPKATAIVEPLVSQSSSSALGSLPPLKTPRARGLSHPDILAELTQEKREQSPVALDDSPAQAIASQPSITSSSPTVPATPVPTAPSPPVRSQADDEAIAKAMREAAKVDAQAKEMMLKAEKLMKEAEARAKEAQKVKIVKEVVVKEVIPDHHVKQQAELKEFNQTILDQRDRIGKELEKTQQVMEAYLKEKEELHAKLKKIESQILGGTSNRKLTETGGNEDGGGDKRPLLVDSEVALLKQQVEYRRAQIKLKEKVKKEAQNEAARKALAIEKQQIEEELKSAQEAAQANLAAAKKKETKYRAKLDAARQEIVDLNNEFERERENLLDTIREQTKETKLLEQLVEIFLPQNELVKVWERAVWVEEREEWTLPKLKPRSDFQKIKLPTLHFSGGGGGSSANPAAGGIESGGAEVISDDEGATGGGGAMQSGGSTVRSSCSSSSSKRRKPSVNLTATNTMGSSSSSKPNSSSDTSMFTGRIEQNGYQSSFLPSYGAGSSATSSSGSHHHHHPPPMHSSRLLSPENGRLPSAVHSSRYDSQKEDPIAESSLSSGHKSKKTSSGGGGGSGSRERKRSKEHRERDRAGGGGGGGGTPPLIPTNNEARSPTDMHAGEKFFPSEDDLLAPLPSEYQPRDRLESRKGSRQGSRGGSGGSDGNGGSNGQSGLDEFENPPPVDKSSRSRGATGSTSTSGSRHRRHRERQDDAYTDNEDLVGAEGVAGEGIVAKKKSSSSSNASSGKHRKKKEKKEKLSQGGDPYDDFDVPNLQFNSSSSAAARSSIQSPEDQDSEYY